jgi:D-glycero-D-manno-heptose 1,7-bisphosphate phosphatase
VFVDRDGVINEMVPSPEGPDSPRSVDEFKLLPGVGGAIRRLNALDLQVVLVSNQPGAAKGKYPASNLDAMTELMKSSLEKDQAFLNGIYYCMHHPEAVVAGYREVCECRKPKPGLLRQAASEMNLTLAGSYMVGDQPKDMTAGKTVGCTTVFVDPGGFREVPGEADYVCTDLVAAAHLIVQLETVLVASS